MAADTWMHFGVQGAMLESARECEAEVFLRWFGNTRAQLEDEYGPYEDSSVFLVIVDKAGEVQGSARLLAPGGRRGLKTMVDVEHEPWGVDSARAGAAVGMDMATTWEIATLGVRRDSAGNGMRLSLALYHGLITVARVNRMSSFVAILDDRVRRLLGSVGVVTRPLPGTATASYLGSASSTPVYVHLAPMLDHQRRHFPDSYRLVNLGIGLDGVAVPSPESFRLRSRAGAGRPAAGSAAPGSLVGAVPLVGPVSLVGSALLR